ncbi:hypothetical protein FISHEDRAFT_70385 [Fistulina hepatica ATCC 64428]|uniref:HNH nuclease domain-containing protein n=1 Tax=Fistulina hepatica ATCC 64428 TaxID=1128425 RepID=A0A0D7AM80_9AGAR|nr:hypothetical protein FISHEDRAFT_70385 [Fistulina hepatica ATCC 64428]
MAATGPVLDRNDGTSLAPGHYALFAAGNTGALRPIRVTVCPEQPRRRSYSINYTFTPHSKIFTARVRARDMRCCFTGETVVPLEHGGYEFTGFEAAHIFPLSETGEFFRWASTASLLILNVERFDDYSVGVDPDDGYRITDFHKRGGRTVDGRIFYINPAVPATERPSDDLLRDHFRQCILANLNASAKPHSNDRPFDPELDLFNGGFDLSNSFWNSHEGQQQFAAEMRGRLEQVRLQSILERGEKGDTREDTIT